MATTAGDTITTYDGMLKQYYDGDKVENLVYDKNRFLLMVEKDEGFVGDAFKAPVIWAGQQGIGHTFATAQAQSLVTSNQAAGFLISNRASMYAITQWQRELMLASATNVGAFMSVAKIGVENALRGLGNQLATALYRSGYGDQGNIAAPFTVSGTTITLVNPGDIVNFEFGQRIVVSATQSGAPKTLGSSNLGPQITGVDRSNGILTFAAALNDGTNGIPTIAAGDFIAIQGNHTTNTQEVLRGIEAWIPATAPLPGDNFWGVDRSQDTRLSGQRLNATSGQSLEEALIQGAQLVAREGGQVDHFFVSFNTYARILTAMQGRVLLTNVDTDKGIGFRGATVQTPAGEALIVPDRTCLDNRIYGLQLDSWTLASLKKLVQVVDDDGLTILRNATSDGYESRYTSYSQLVCRAPGWNVNIQIPTA